MTTRTPMTNSESANKSHAEWIASMANKLPTATMHKVKVDGKPAARVVIGYATKNAELDRLSTELGFTGVCDIANHREFYCTTQDQVKAVKSMLFKFFNADWSYKG